MPHIKYWYRSGAEFLFLLLVINSGCKPVDVLQSTPAGAVTPQIRFHRHDSLGAAAISLDAGAFRPAPVVRADGARYSADTVACFTDERGRHIILVNRQPYLQIVAGRIDLYRRLRPGNPLNADSIQQSRRNPFDFMQKLPDDRLHHMTGGSLVRLTVDHPRANALAKAYRFNSRWATACLAAGATLAAAGAVTAFAGGLVSDVGPEYRRPYYITGAAAFFAGTALLSVPLPIFGRRALGYRNRAINTYNLAPAARQ